MKSARQLFSISDAITSLEASTIFQYVLRKLNFPLLAENSPNSYLAQTHLPNPPHRPPPLQAPRIPENMAPRRGPSALQRHPRQEPPPPRALPGTASRGSHRRLRRAHRQTRAKSPSSRHARHCPGRTSLTGSGGKGAPSAAAPPARSRSPPRHSPAAAAAVAGRCRRREPRQGARGRRGRRRKAGAGRGGGRWLSGLRWGRAASRRRAPRRPGAAPSAALGAAVARCSGRLPALTGSLSPWRARAAGRQRPAATASLSPGPDLPRALARAWAGVPSGSTVFSRCEDSLFSISATPNFVLFHQHTSFFLWQRFVR